MLRILLIALALLVLLEALLATITLWWKANGEGGPWWKYLWAPLGTLAVWATVVAFLHIALVDLGFGYLLLYRVGLSVVLLVASCLAISGLVFLVWPYWCQDCGNRMLHYHWVAGRRCTYCHYGGLLRLRPVAGGTSVMVVVTPSLRRLLPAPPSEYELACEAGVRVRMVRNTGQYMVETLTTDTRFFDTASDARMHLFKLRLTGVWVPPTVFAALGRKEEDRAA